MLSTLRYLGSSCPNSISNINFGISNPGLLCGSNLVRIQQDLDLSFWCRRCVISAAYAHNRLLTSFLKSAPLVYSMRDFFLWIERGFDFCRLAVDVALSRQWMPEMNFWPHFWNLHAWFTIWEFFVWIKRGLYFRRFAVDVALSWQRLLKFNFWPHFWNRHPLTGIGENIWVHFYFTISYYPVYNFKKT